jgi:hypothetical protein
MAEITLDSEASALFEVWHASRTDAKIRKIFTRLEAENERVSYKTIVSSFGKEAAESTPIMYLFDGATYLIRGLALQNILQKNMTQDPRWLFWRRKLAEDIFACIARDR